MSINEHTGLPNSKSYAEKNYDRRAIRRKSSTREFHRTGVFPRTANNDCPTSPDFLCDSRGRAVKRLSARQAKIIKKNDRRRKKRMEVPNA